MSSCPACGRSPRQGQRVRVVPVFSNADPALVAWRNRHPLEPAPERLASRTDHYHPACADALGLVHEPRGGTIWLPAEEAL